MKLIHHVKKHGKTITLHLKKHHKKYIFGILSATLLRKGVSLIAAYALVHNLSFSFADIIHQGEGDDEEIIVEEIINNNEQVDGNQEDGLGTILRGNEGDNGELDDGNNGQSTLSKDYCPDGDYSDSYYDGDCGNSEEDKNHTHGSAGDEGINEDGDNGIIGNGDDGINLDGDDGNDGNGDDGNNGDGDSGNDGNGDEAENSTLNGLESNGKCDRGDIEITSPMEGNIVGGIFNITWKFINDDCKDERYIIKLRESNDEYIEIYSGDVNTTGISFDSTQLLLNYYSGHKISIVQDSTEYNTIYRNEEGGDFTIDNKAPKLSNTGVQYSTKNKKLNIGDTVTVSFESDEELTGVTVNIQGTKAYLDEKIGNKYKYTMEFTENNNTGKIVYGIDYSDIAGNTGYYERYDNIELDYTTPKMENINMTKSGNEIRVIFDTDKITNAYLVYMISGAKYTNSSDSSSKTGHEFILNDIRNKLKYNYSIAIEDEAKNKLNIGGDFYLSGDKVIFTNKEIRAGDLITEAGFKTGDEQALREKLNSFDKCSENIKFKNINLPIDGMTGKLIMPSYTNSSINQMTNAFTTLLVKRIEGKAFSQRDLDEIFEDLNNFLIVVKLVKDDANECKQNMSQYYINKFKKTLIKYKLVNN